jgi:hypothetical protein
MENVAAFRNRSLAAEKGQDFRLIRNTTVWGKFVNNPRQCSGKLGEQLLFTHPSASGQVGNRGLTEGGSKLVRLDWRVLTRPDPGGRGLAVTGICQLL